MLGGDKLHDAALRLLVDVRGAVAAHGAYGEYVSQQVSRYLILCILASLLLLRLLSTTLVNTTLRCIFDSAD